MNKWSWCVSLLTVTTQLFASHANSVVGIGVTQGGGRRMWNAVLNKCDKYSAVILTGWTYFVDVCYLLLIKRYSLCRVLACSTTFFQLSLFCTTLCLGRPKIICPAFPRWAFLTNIFPVWGSWPHDKPPNLEDHDLSGVISPRRIAFTTAKDSRLAPSYPWGRGPRQVLPPGPGGPVAHNGRGATPWRRNVSGESSFPLTSPNL